MLIVVAGALLAPVVLPALGFKPAGVAAGSIAAAIQGPAVAAGSAFAIAQSAGAKGAGACAWLGAKVGIVVAVVVPGAGGCFYAFWRLLLCIWKKERLIISLNLSPYLLYVLFLFYISNN